MCQKSPQSPQSLYLVPINIKCKGKGRRSIWAPPGLRWTRPWLLASGDLRLSRYHMISHWPDFWQQVLVFTSFSQSVESIQIKDSSRICEDQQWKKDPHLEHSFSTSFPSNTNRTSLSLSSHEGECIHEPLPDPLWSNFHNAWNPFWVAHRCLWIVYVPAPSGGTELFIMFLRVFLQ